MATITTEVEFDIEDIDTYDLVNELSNRIGRFKRKQLTGKLLENLRADFSELAEKLNFADSGLQIKTLEDKLKVEHLTKVWDKYTSWQIENLLP
jgi:hypothetical protein